MRKTLIAGFAAVSFATVANADYRSSVDDDGCWDARNVYGSACMVRVSGHRENGRAEVVYTNKCSQRIYARICLQRVGKRDSCGQSGMRPGEDFKWYTHDSTGQVDAKALGSTNSSMDWVCGDKFRGWRE